jgi:beta-galactosidase
MQSQSCLLLPHSTPHIPTQPVVPPCPAPCPAGPEVVTVVDFGPSQDLTRAFALQQLFNPPGMSPPMCSEFYTGWLTHWGEVMANTSTETAAEALQKLLAFAGHTASVNLYMAHGGTNFGFWAGG